MRGLCVLAALCLLLSGCDSLPYPREMGDMALLRTMGVDRDGDALVVTASTGPRARGLQGEGMPSLVLSARQQSLSAACLAMQGLSDNYVFFGYVDQLLLGEELASQGIVPVLDYFARDVELGLGARLWLVKGETAGEVVRAGGEQGVDSRLTTLQADGEMGAALMTRTAGEVFSDLLEWGCAYAPALSAGTGEESPLMERGYGILRDGALVGVLEGEEARGLELLAGRPPADILEERLEGNRVSVRTTGCTVLCTLSREGEQTPELELRCRLEARPVEYERPLSEAEMEELGGRIGRRQALRIRQAMERLRGWGTDCTGLGPKAALSNPGLWEGQKDNWDQIFSQLEYRVSVEVSMYE